MDNPFVVVNLTSYLLACAREQAQDAATERMLRTVPPALVRQVLMETVEGLLEAHGGLEFAPPEDLRTAFDKAATKLILLRTAN